MERLSSISIVIDARCRMVAGLDSSSQSKWLIAGYRFLLGLGYLVLLSYGLLWVTNYYATCQRTAWMWYEWLFFLSFLALQFGYGHGSVGMEPWRKPRRFSIFAVSFYTFWLGFFVYSGEFSWDDFVPKWGSYYGDSSSSFVVFYYEFLGFLENGFLTWFWLHIFSGTFFTGAILWKKKRGAM